MSLTPKIRMKASNHNLIKTSQIGTNQLMNKDSCLPACP